MEFADFEESEYRGSLYNQLEMGSHLVWEPGQVFEEHIGIDRAAYVVHQYFWGLFGRSSPLPGIYLNDYDWDYIRSQRRKMKLLPDFKLNLFLQAKRPSHGKRPRTEVRKYGITGEYYKMSITRHQQATLLRMADKLNGGAIVCYACPAFHTQAALYENTVNRTIVENSTFPLVSELKSHSAWYYQEGGTHGVANPEYKRLKHEPLMSHVEHLIAQEDDTISDARTTLNLLASRIIQSTDGIEQPSSADTWYRVLLNRIDAEMQHIAKYYQFESPEYLKSVKSYLQVRSYCFAHRMSWFVLGKETD